MKRFFLFVMSTLLMCSSVFAKELVSFTYRAIDDRPLGHSHPKSHDETPTVYIEDYTLSFEANHPEYLLSIRDEDGYVVYTTMVYSTETQVVLPTTLSGDYMIELAIGELLFTGWINL